MAFKHTLPHSIYNKYDKYTVRTSNALPKDAINLAYYYNKPLSPKKCLNMINAAKMYNNYMSIKHTEIKTNLSKKNDSAFDPYFHYFDKYGYEGMFKLRKIDWFEHKHGITKNLAVKDDIVLKEPIAPKSKDMLTEDGYKGTLYLGSVQYSIKDYEEKEIKGKKFKAYNGRIIKYNLKDKNQKRFPTYYPVIDYPYSGKLPLDRIDTFIPIYYNSKYDILNKNIYIADDKEANPIIQVKDKSEQLVSLPLIDVRQYTQDTFEKKKLGIITDDCVLNKNNIDFSKVFPKTMDEIVTLENGKKLLVHGTYSHVGVQDLGKKTVYEWGIKKYYSSGHKNDDDYYEYDKGIKKISGKWKDYYPKQANCFYNQRGEIINTLSISGWRFNEIRKTSNGGTSGAEWIHKINFIPPNKSYTRNCIKYLRKIGFNDKQVITTFLNNDDSYYSNSKKAFTSLLSNKHYSSFVWDKLYFKNKTKDFTINTKVDTQNIYFNSKNLTKSITDFHDIFKWLGDPPHTEFTDSRRMSDGCFVGSCDMYAVLNKGVYKYSYSDKKYKYDWWPNQSTKLKLNLKDYRPYINGKSPSDQSLAMFNDPSPAPATLIFTKFYDDGIYDGELDVLWHQNVYFQPQPSQVKEGTLWKFIIAKDYWWELKGTLFKKNSRYFRPSIQYYMRDVKQELIYPIYKYNIYEAVYSGMSTSNNTKVKNYRGASYYTGALERNDIIDKYKEPNSWLANCLYTGTINKTWFSYDGYALYSGIALKTNNINNINPDNDNIIRMYSDEKGILYNEKGFKQINSQNFILTEISKNNIPLFYKYKTKYPIYNTIGPNEKNILQDNSVILVDKNNNKIDNSKYEIILKPYNTSDKKYEHTYNVYVYTSFINNFNNPLYVVYNAYHINNKNAIIPVFKEQIDLIETDNKTNYDVEQIDVRKNLYYIKIKKTRIIKDDRHKIHIKFKIETTDKKYTSNIYNANIINKKYAFPNELYLFKKNYYNISPIDKGITLNAIDIIKKDCRKQLTIPGTNYEEFDNSKIAELKEKIFTIKLVLEDAETNANKEKVILYTAPDGYSFIYAETTEDTGTYDIIKENYSKQIVLPNLYTIKDSTIYPGYYIKCKDVTSVTVGYPREKYNLENWYPLIKAGNFNKTTELHGIKVNSIYSIPEYNNQNWSTKYNRPYIDIKDETAEIINKSVIKIRYTPMYIDFNFKNNSINNIKIIKIDTLGNIKNLNIKNIYFNEGIIILDTSISLNDTIKVSYTYEENNLIYKGYYDNNDIFIDLDLNPFKHHSYRDTEPPYERHNTYDLFDKTIYFYLKPQYIKNEENNNKIIDNAHLKSFVYHRINNSKPYNENDIEIGSIYIKHNSSLKDCYIKDTRTRGGGVLKEMLDSIRHELEPESDYYWDIGYYEGEPYNENGIIIIRLDKRILRKFGGKFTEEEVEYVINKFDALGVLPIIEYVDAYIEEKTPQKSLDITTSFNTNETNTPSILIKSENNVTAPDVVLINETKISTKTPCLIMQSPKKDNLLCLIEVK